MTRLIATIQHDARTQFRQNLYHINLGLAVLFVVILRFALKSTEARGLLLPFFLFTSTSVGYLYAGVMLLFEKNENTLSGLVVTPLRKNEYLWSKVISVTVLILLETAIVAFGGYGFGLNAFYLFAGIFSMTLLFSLVGLALVVRYRTINDFLMPSIAIGILFQLPFLDYFDIWTTPLFYLLPSHAGILLIKAAFQPVSTGQLVYAGIYITISIIAAYVWASNAFEKHIIRQ